MSQAERCRLAIAEKIVAVRAKKTSFVDQRVNFKQTLKTNFKNYQVRDYFGTFHSFENLDVLFLEGGSLTNCWNWKFNQNTLELTKFELNDNQMHYHLSNQKIYLKKLD